MLMQLTRKAISKSEFQPILRRLVAGLVRDTDPEEIILFGSLARDEFTDGSDIDVIILFADTNLMKKGKDNLATSGIIVDWPVDYLFYTCEEYRIRMEIGGVCMLAAEEGISLFKKESK